MKRLIFILILLTSCGKKTDSIPVTVASNPNAALEPSAATCSEIKAKLFGDYFIDMKPDVLFLTGATPYFIDPQGNMIQFMGDSIPLGTFCTLEVVNGQITGVL